MRALTVTLLVCLSAPALGEPAKLTIPLRVRVARCGGQRVRDTAWVDAHLEATRRVFGRHGINLDVTRETFTPKRCTLLNAAQRHALAHHVEMDGKATVLLVRRVRDLAVPTYDLMGVHWRYRGRNRRLRGRRWVLLTARARPPVLAHELAHYFGLRHDRKGGNLMTPGPSDLSWRSARPPRPFKARLTKTQARQLRRAIKRFGRN
ncbi:MAG: hypothetical protein JRH20_18995 [Deltaproteobacteria bacterium]|nr:hypothetical protein [Deltaproteobacteria bacterium]